MDAVAGLLDGPRARGAFLLRSVLEPPWAMRVQDEAPLTLLVLVCGSAWLVQDGHDDVRLGAGDTAVLRGPEPYVLAEPLGTPVQVVVHPGQRCAAPDGSDVTGMDDLGVRTWGNAADGGTVLLSGTYQLRSEVSRRLLGALPAQLVLPAGQGRHPLLEHLADEVGRDEPGQEAVLDRLLDLVLIATLRAWAALPSAGAPGWYRASADPVVGPALRLLHREPARPWTVASLASCCGLSRAAFARRFHDLVGEPPMAFLTSWRLTMAADLLLEPGATVGSVARQVGYGSPFALSAAFKRERGVSPAQHRASA